MKKYSCFITFYRKLRGDFLSEGENNDQPTRKQPIQLPREEERSPPPGRQPSPPRRQPSPPRREPSPPPRQQSPPRREPSPPPREPSPPPREPSPPPRSPSPPRQTSPPPSTESTPKTRNLLAEGMPQRQDSDEEQDVDVWEDGKIVFHMGKGENKCLYVFHIVREKKCL